MRGFKVLSTTHGTRNVIALTHVTRWCESECVRQRKGAVRMCHQVTCKVCTKTGWAGCGQHVSQVMAGVPKSQRCTCTAADKAAYKAAHPGLFARMFGRGGK